MRNKVIDIHTHIHNPQKKQVVEDAILLLKNEIREEIQQNKKVKCPVDIEKLSYNNINENILKQLEEYFDKINRYYIEKYNKASNEKDKLMTSLQDTPEKKEAFIKLKKRLLQRQLKKNLFATKPK